MPRDLQAFAIHQFLGFNDAPPASIADGEASALENLYPVGSRLVRRNGQATVGPSGGASLGAGMLDLLSWARIDSTEFLLGLYAGSVRDWLGTPATPLTGGSSRFASGSIASAAWVDRNVYIGNGRQQNVRWNGLNVKQAMVPAMTGSISTHVLSPTGTGVVNGTIRYAVCFLNADGIPGEPFESATSIDAVNNKIAVLNIPICAASEDCTGRAIYRRNEDVTDTYRLVATIDNTVPDWIDNHPDTDLTVELVFGNTRFPPCAYLVERGNRLIGAGCIGVPAPSGTLSVDGDPRTLYISGLRQPYYCPILPNLDDATQGTRISLQDVAGGIITGLANHGAFVAVFTGGAAYLLAGDDPNSFTLSRFTNHGCVAHRTIQSIRNWLLWLGPDGVYAADGQSVERISDRGLYNTMLGLSASGAARAWSYVWDDKYYLVIPNVGAYYFDLGHQQWGKYRNWNFGLGTTTSYTSDKRPRIYAAATGMAQVTQLEIGNTDLGTPITAKWMSKDADFGLPFHEKRIAYYAARFLATSGTVTLNLYRNGGTSALATSTVSLSGDQANDAGTSLAKAFLRPPESARGEFFRLEISSSTLHPSFELLAIGGLYSIAT